MREDSPIQSCRNIQSHEEAMAPQLGPFTLGLKWSDISISISISIFYLVNMDVDTVINWMSKFIIIFVLNGYKYISEIESMDVRKIVKLYDHHIKDITK